MRLKNLLLIVVLISGICLQINAQRTDKDLVEDLDAYFEKALSDWNVPGMAIGIVKDNKLIMAEGYGIRQLGLKHKVDENTVFPIASNTKAFTAATLAFLVAEGKVDWDDKVRKHLPYFELYNPYVSNNMTIRDLLSHRSGLKTFSGDLIWYGTTYSREEVVKRAKFLKPEFGFREYFGYQNIMFIAAGEIVSAVSGKTWDEYLNEKIFDPLNMTSSVTSTSYFDRMDNVAMPHTERDDKVVSIPHSNWDNIGGAGAINSNVLDMANWLKFQLNRGSFEGKELIPAGILTETWKPHTLQGVSTFSRQLWPTTHFKAYALGWGTSDYHGRKIISHSGGYDGIISYSCIVPEENLGFVILTNKNSSLYYPLYYKILDSFLSDDDTDWSAKFLEFNQRNNAGKEQGKNAKEEARVKGTETSLKLEDYCGTYGGKVYGNVEVKLIEDHLEVYFIPSPIFTGKLNHYHFDTFTIKLKDVPSLPEGTARFILDEKGKPQQLVIDIPNPDFYFTELDLYKLD